MEEEIKSNAWLIPERVIRTNKVIFLEELTMGEALLKFSEGEYEDIIDWSDETEEVWDTAEPMNSDLE